MKRELGLVTALILLALLACRGTMDTVISEDGSGSLSFEVEIPLEEDQDPDDVNCEVDQSLPPETSMRREVDGRTVRCILETTFDDLDGLRELHASSEGSTTVECLALFEDRLIYDVRLEPDSSDSEALAALAFVWNLTVPGAVERHNADQQRGQTLTWSMESVSGRSFQVNLNPDGSCPTEPLMLSLHVSNEGTGHAVLEAPVLPTGPSDTLQLIEALRQSGWQVEDPAPRAASFQAQRSWDSEAAFQAIPGSLPPFAGSGTNLDLTMEEDPDSGVRRFTFGGRLDLSAYAGYWEGLNPKLQVPDFEFEYFPPGTVDYLSGDWTDNVQLRALWSPGAPASIPLRARSLYDPQLGEHVSPEAAQANLENIMARFADEIPAGQIAEDPSTIQSVLSVLVGSGTANNMTNWTDWSCGDYQTRVLAWLDEIRTHSDAEVRDQLAGLDYGPVQAYMGGHQAVVIFPRGTDWRETGTVLDPWPEQRPQTFTMDEWRDRFPFGHGVGEEGESFRHMYGGPPAYPTNVSNDRLHQRRIGVNSPVAALITASDGRRLGMLPDGNFVNEIPGADFYPEPKGEGEYQWYFGLPEGAYELTLTGTAEGDVHVMVADESERLVTYGPQPISDGATASLTVGPEGVDQDLELPSGERVEPITVTEDNVTEIDFGDPRQVTPDEAASLPSGGTRLPLLLGLILCTWAPLAAGWTLLALRFRRE